MPQHAQCVVQNHLGNARSLAVSRFLMVCGIVFSLTPVKFEGIELIQTDLQSLIFDGLVFMRSEVHILLK